jgi:hypothetical protein
LSGYEYGKLLAFFDYCEHSESYAHFRLGLFVLQFVSSAIGNTPNPTKPPG